MGRSSPIVVKDRLYLTALEGDSARHPGARREDRSGQLAPRDPARAQHQDLRRQRHRHPDAASDGESLYVFFPDLGLVSFDLAGAERWRLALGPFESFYGISSSPVVHGARSRSCATSASARSCWRSTRAPAACGGGRSASRRRPRATRPRHLRAAGGRPQLVVSGTCRDDGYDLESRREPVVDRPAGDLPDRLAGPARRHGDRGQRGRGRAGVSGVRRDPEKLDMNKDEWLCARGIRKPSRVQGPLRLAGRGQDGGSRGRSGRLNRKRAFRSTVPPEAGSAAAATAPRRTSSGGTRSGSRSWSRRSSTGRLYLVKNGGIVTTLDPRPANPQGGRTVEGIDEYFASPVAGDGKVYLLSQSGKVTVLKAGAQWEILR